MHAVEVGETPQVDRYLDDVGEGGAVLGQDQLEVLENLAGLTPDVTRMNQPALKGGKRSRSVSSSNNLAQPEGRVLTFFRIILNRLLTLSDVDSSSSCRGLFHT